MGDNVAKQLEIKVDEIRTSRSLARPMLRIGFGGFYIKDVNFAKQLKSAGSSTFSTLSPHSKASSTSSLAAQIHNFEQFPISYSWPSKEISAPDPSYFVAVSSYASPTLFTHVSSVIFGETSDAEEVSFAGRSFFFPLSEHSLLFDSISVGVYEYCLLGGYRVIGTTGFDPPHHAATSTRWMELEPRSGTTSRILICISVTITDTVPCTLFTPIGGGQIESLDANGHFQRVSGINNQPQLSSTRLPLWLRPLRTLLDENTVNLGVRVLLKLLASFGQGLEAYSHSTLLGALIILARFETWKRKNGFFSLALVCKRIDRIIRDQGSIDLAKHAFKFAIASYGWKGLTLLGRRSLHHILSNPSSERNAILTYLDLKECDLLHLTESNGLFQPHCVIFYDVRSPDGPSIVVALRGSLSATDWMTSFGGEYLPWHGGFLHLGVAKAAQYVKKEILPLALAYAKKMDVSKILITGHSLGGAAALLTLLFHHFDDEDENEPGAGADDNDEENVEDRNITLRAISFGAPPIVSMDLLPIFKGLSATSYIFGGDVVPRISYGSLMDYRALIVRATSHVSLKNILNPVVLS